MHSSKRHQLVQQLYSDGAYGKLRTNLDRVKYVLTKVLPYDKCRRMLETAMQQAKVDNGKSLLMASSFLNEAEVLWEQANKSGDEKIYKAVVEAVDKAIRATPSAEAHFLAKLYGRKARAHIALDDFGPALHSVKIGLELHPSCESLSTIRRELLAAKRLSLGPGLIQEQFDDLCDEAREESLLEEIIENPTLKPKKTEEPFYSYKMDERCSIQCSPVVGRYMVAKGGVIPEGTLLLEEKPYSLILESDLFHTRCSGCNAELNARLFPCTGCTEVAFCSRACFELANHLFHKYECGFAKCIKSITTPTLHVFRITSRVGPLEAFELQNGLPLYGIGDYLAEGEQRTLSEQQKSPDTKGRAYKMQTTLCAHDEKHNLLKNVHHTLIAIECAAFLDLVHNVRAQYRNKFDATDEQVDDFWARFIAMLIVDTRRVVFNVFGWHLYNSRGEFRASVANCMFVVSSLVNHNCAPNTHWQLNENGSIQFTTNRAIEEGEEITITYGPSRQQDYFKRQTRLNHYFFACKCMLCLGDALLSSNLRCRTCKHGPVPYNSAANDEPEISGKCIICFAKFEDFDATIEQLREVKRRIRGLVSMSLLVRDDAAKDFVALAVDEMKRLIDLALPSSSTIPSYLSSVMLVLQRLSKLAPICEDTLVEMAVLLHRNLPYELPASVVNGEMLTNLHFWIELLAASIKESAAQESTDTEPYWAAIAGFKTRLHAAIDRTILGTDIDEQHLPVLRELGDQLIDRCDSAVRECEPLRSAVKEEDHVLLG